MTKILWFVGRWKYDSICWYQRPLVWLYMLPVRIRGLKSKWKLKWFFFRKGKALRKALEGDHR